MSKKCELRYKNQLLCATILISFLQAGYAVAEDASPKSDTTIGEVVVTARNRAETLQNVPLAISAIPATVLENQHLETIADITKLEPSLVFDHRFGLQDNEPAIRGLSADRGRQSVGTLIDGVDITSESMGATAGGSLLVDSRLLDLERVEVVEGPQSALYGRAAFGGAIDYITKKPSDTLGATINASAGMYGEYEVRAAITGPITQGLDFRVNGFYSQSDGYYKNQVNNQSVGGYNASGGMLSLSYNPVPAFHSLLQLSYSRNHDQPAAQEYIGSANNEDVALPYPASFLSGPPGAGSPSSVQGPPLGTLEPAATGVRLSVDPATGKNLPGAITNTFRVALHMDYDFGWADLKSITSYLHASFSELDDDDFYGATAAPVTNPTPGGVYEPLNTYGVIDLNDGKIGQVSQEFRLGNLDAKTFRWAVGFLYWHEDYSQNDQSFTSVGVLPNSSGALNFLDVGNDSPPGPGERVTDSFSYYGLAEVDFLHYFTLSVEGRYFDENYNYTFSPYIYSYFGATASPAVIYMTPTPASTKADYFTPKATLRFRPTDDFMAYATFSEGEKPGGYNTVSIVSSEGNSYGPEKLRNYEIGAKYRTPDRRLTLSGDAFYMQYDNKQESVVVANSLTASGFVSEIANIGGALVKGVELNFAAVPVSGLTLTVSYAYLDAKYTNYPLQIGAGPTAGVYGPLLKNGCTPNTPIGTALFCVTNLAGNRLEYSPENSVVVTGRYVHPISGTLKAFIEADGRYTGNRPTDEYNVRFIPAQTVVNAQIGLEAERWTGLIYVENLFDEDKIESGFLTGDFFHQGQTAIVVTPASPIRAGVRLSYKF